MFSRIAMNIWIVHFCFSVLQICCSVVSKNKIPMPFNDEGIGKINGIIFVIVEPLLMILSVII